MSPEENVTRLRIAALDEEHGVTPRELFFDLVFVFGFTQVATLLAHEPTFAGIGRSILVLGALWWPWTAYAWLTNTVDPEEGVVGAALLVALIAIFVAALAVPSVFGDDGVLFGAAFLVVFAMHAGALRARRPREPRTARRRASAGAVDAARRDADPRRGLTAARAHGSGSPRSPARTSARCSSGSTGWQVHASHFAERYGLV